MTLPQPVKAARVRPFSNWPTNSRGLASHRFLNGVTWQMLPANHPGRCLWIRQPVHFRDFTS